MDLRPLAPHSPQVVLVEPGLLLGFAFANVEGRDPLGASLPEFVFTNGTTSSVQVCRVLVVVVVVAAAVEGGCTVAVHKHWP